MLPETKPAGKIAAAWHARAEELATWAMARLVNRLDVWGIYVSSGVLTAPAKADRGTRKLTHDILLQHFLATERGHVIGLHTTSISNTCLWGAIEVDAHEGDGSNPVANFRYARRLVSKLEDLGFAPLLTDSNGAGGYHIHIFFIEPQPSDKIFAFLRSLVADFATWGLDRAPETFPKQASVEPGKFGNWLRVPGRHHSREHWSKVWNGKEWLEGNDAIDCILAIQGDDGTLLPEVELVKPTEPPASTKPAASTTSTNYAQAALVSDCGKVATAPIGSRNSTFNTACFAMGTLVAAGALDRDEVETQLAEAARRAGLSQSEIEATMRSGLESGLKSPRVIPEPAGKPDTAGVLVSLVSEAGGELWHDDAHVAYCSIPINGHRENYRIKSKGFKGWLRQQFFSLKGKPPNNEALQTAIGTLEGLADFQGPCYQVAVRLAGFGGKVFLDLGTESWEAIEVDAKGWRIIPGADCPIRFIRPKGLLPLPEPERGGDVVELLAPFLNVKGDDLILLVAWLVAAMAPNGPFLILLLLAEQGSGKSLAARILRACLDPNTAPLRSEPREPRDMLIAGSNSRVLVLDNLSKILLWLSDMLCRFATGGGCSFRTLYEDQEETIFNVMLPMIITAITDVCRNSDLIDRGLFVRLEPLNEAKYRTEAEIWEAFGKVHGQILGGLLDAVACAIRRLPTLKLDRLPRMGDAAKWVEAASPSLGWQPLTFMTAYTRNRAEASSLALGDSVIAEPIRTLVTMGSGKWRGTIGKLLDSIATGADLTAIRSSNWPKSPRGLADQLRRIAPNLRRDGIEVVFEPRKTAGIVVNITRVPDNRGKDIHDVHDVHGPIKNQGKCDVHPQNDLHGHVHGPSPAPGDDVHWENDVHADVHSENPANHIANVRHVFHVHENPHLSGGLDVSTEAPTEAVPLTKWPLHKPEPPIPPEKLEEERAKESDRLRRVCAQIDRDLQTRKENCP